MEQYKCCLSETFIFLIKKFTSCKFIRQIKYKEDKERRLIMLNRKKWFLVIFSVFVLVGCSSEETHINPSEAVEKEGLTIITSFSILGDIAGEIVGNRGTVEYLVPIGEEPHEYEPVPSDFQKVSDSDVFYVNGLNLEEWLEKLVANVGEIPVVAVSDGITPIMLEGNNEEDPHAWLAIENVKTYVNNILNDLIERDPSGESEYRSNAEQYLKELDGLEAWINEMIESVPNENRFIVVTENAFKYFGASYGFQTEGVWDINSQEEGTPGQVGRVIDLVNDQQIPSLFVETTVDKRYMQTISLDTGVNIAGEVYTDAVGPEGSGAETYILMMKHNVETFVSGLK